MRCDGEVWWLLFRDVDIVMLTTLRSTDKVLPSGVTQTLRREVSSWIYGRMRFLRGYQVCIGNNHKLNIGATFQGECGVRGSAGARHFSVVLFRRMLLQVCCCRALQARRRTLAEESKGFV